MIIQMVKSETKLSFEDVLVYVWDSPDSMKEYRESDLAAGIPQVYKFAPPEVEGYEVASTLRD